MRLPGNALRTDYITQAAQHGVDAPMNVLKQEQMEQMNQLRQHAIERLQFQDEEDMYDYFLKVQPNITYENHDEVLDYFGELAGGTDLRQLGIPDKAYFEKEAQRTGKTPFEIHKKWKAGVVNDLTEQRKQKAWEEEEKRKAKAAEDKAKREAKAAEDEAKRKEAAHKQTQRHREEEFQLKKKLARRQKGSGKEDQRLKNLMDEVQSIDKKIASLKVGENIWIPQANMSREEAIEDLKKLRDTYAKRYVELKGPGSEADVALEKDENTRYIVKDGKLVPKKTERPK